MKQKVLLALIALFSFVSAWAVDRVTVYEDGTVKYAVIDDDGLVAEDLQVKIGNNTLPGVKIFAEDRVTEVQTITQMGNYFLQVAVDDQLKLFPFQAAEVAVAGTDFEIIKDETSWNNSAANGGLKYYLQRYPGEDRWNLSEGRVALEMDKVDGEWTDNCPHSWLGAVYAAGAQYPWLVLNCGADDARVKAIVTMSAKIGDGTQTWTVDDYFIDSRPGSLMSIPTSFVAAKQTLLGASQQMFPTFALARVGAEWGMIANQDELDQDQTGTVKPVTKEDITVEEYNSLPDEAKAYYVKNSSGYKALLGGATPEYKAGNAESNPQGQTYSVLFEEPSYVNISVLIMPAQLPNTGYANYDWTLSKTSQVYTGTGVNLAPFIKVTADNFVEGANEKVEIPEEESSGAKNWIVKYYTSYEEDGETGEMVLGGAVDPMKHAGTYYVQPYLAVDTQTGYDAGDPIGEPKTFTIKQKKTLTIDLAQVHMQYGDNEETIEPKFSLSGFVGEDQEDDFFIDGLGYVKRGPNYVGTDLVAGTVIQYTTTGIPHAYTGTTYDDEGNVVDKGYEDYETRLLTNNAQLIADPGVITIEFMEGALYKTYGEKDPDFSAVYQNTDAEADYYTEVEDEVGLPVYWRAYNQSGELVDLTEDPITITREKAAVYEDDELVSAEGEDVGEYDIYVTTTRNYLFYGFEESDAEVLTDPAGYKWTLEDQFSINPFDISKDYAKDAVLAKNAVYSFTSYGDANGQTEYATGTVEVTGITGDKATITVLTNSVDGFEGNVYTIDATDPTNESTLRQLYDGDVAQDIWVKVALKSEAVEAQDAYEEKFVIAMPQVTYNADTQYPDPTITFKHDVLGVINLTYQADGTTPLKPFVGKGKTYTTDSYWYKKTVKGGGDYKSNQAVKRDATAPTTILAGATITVHAVESDLEATPAVCKNFTGAKSQKWTINPAPLSVKVKGTPVGGMSYAGKYPNFGIELDPEGANPWPAKENDDDIKAGILTALGVNITAYKTTDATATNYDAVTGTAYGYDYDGTVGEKTISVVEAAKKAVNVILAAKNYTPEYASGANTINEIVLAFKASKQTIDYPAPAGGVYTKPVIDTRISLSRPAVYWTQEEINAAQEGDPAFGKTTETIKDAAVLGTVELVGDMPEGLDYDALEDLIEPLYDKINQHNVTKATTTANALSIDRKENVENPVGYNITEQRGELTINPLLEMHLDYANMAQALEDHQGIKMNKVYMPNRNLKNKRWYSMVLPFDVVAEDFFATDKLGYGAFETLDKENTNGNTVRFKLTIEKIAANTPFILKVFHDHSKSTEGVAPYPTDDNHYLGEIFFENKTIAVLPEGQAYNQLEKSPFSIDGAETKFIGQYTGKVGMEDNERWMTAGEFKKGYPVPVNEDDHAATVLDPTAAYLSFKTAEQAANARIYVEELDGTVTAIESLDVAGNEDDEDAESAASFAEGWYTITGVKLTAEPTVSGTYIYNGKKVYIKK